MMLRKRLCNIIHYDSYCMLVRIPTAKLKIPGKAFLKSETRTSVTFKLKFLTLAFYQTQQLPMVGSLRSFPGIFNFTVGILMLVIFFYSLVSFQSVDNLNH